ncbi:endochitinase A-like [Hyalella azteca]|uniref:Endochitinase A-like n=1 Tax=Hyalella azteca TaxID=294128 RepID=A0A979FW40_HYAAZ|nr:endochitinase A-like [Hyalella azteca]
MQQGQSIVPQINIATAQQISPGKQQALSGSHGVAAVSVQPQQHHFAIAQHAPHNVSIAQQNVLPQTHQSVGAHAVQSALPGIQSCIAQSVIQPGGAHSVMQPGMAQSVIQPGVTQSVLQPSVQVVTSTGLQPLLAPASVVASALTPTPPPTPSAGSLSINVVGTENYRDNSTLFASGNVTTTNNPLLSPVQQQSSSANLTQTIFPAGTLFARSEDAAIALSAGLTHSLATIVSSATSLAPAVSPSITASAAPPILLTSSLLPSTTTASSHHLILPSSDLFMPVANVSRAPNAITGLDQTSSIGTNKSLTTSSALPITIVPHQPVLPSQPNQLQSLQTIQSQAVQVNDQKFLSLLSPSISQPTSISCASSQSLAASIVASSSQSITQGYSTPSNTTSTINSTARSKTLNPKTSTLARLLQQNSHQYTKICGEDWSEVYGRGTGGGRYRVVVSSSGGAGGTNISITDKRNFNTSNNRSNFSPGVANSSNLNNSHIVTAVSKSCSLAQLGVTEVKDKSSWAGSNAATSNGPLSYENKFSPLTTESNIAGAAGDVLGDASRSASSGAGDVLVQKNQNKPRCSSPLVCLVLDE